MRRSVCDPTFDQLRVHRELIWSPYVLAYAWLSVYARTIVRVTFYLSKHCRHSSCLLKIYLMD